MNPNERMYRIHFLNTVEHGFGWAVESCRHGDGFWTVVRSGLATISRAEFEMAALGGHSR